MRKVKYKINEIFFSIQCEGSNVGMPAVFIRFAGCNLKCSWCDTDYSEKMSLTEDEILEEIRKYGCYNVILTGGEPTEQDIFSLTKLLKMKKYDIFLETNGLNDEKYSFIDWVTVSPKNLENWNLKAGNELKLVYIGQSEEELYHYWVRSNFDYYYLQPCSGIDINKVVEIVKKLDDWRLSCQVQKLINIK